jgi:hypothetical protein
MPTLTCWPQPSTPPCCSTCPRLTSPPARRLPNGSRAAGSSWQSAYVRPDRQASGSSSHHAFWPAPVTASFLVPRKAVKAARSRSSRPGDGSYARRVPWAGARYGVAAGRLRKVDAGGRRLRLPASGRQHLTLDGVRVGPAASSLAPWGFNSVTGLLIPVCQATTTVPGPSYHLLLVMHRPGRAENNELFAEEPGRLARLVLLLLHDFPEPGKFHRSGCSSPSDTSIPHGLPGRGMPGRHPRSAFGRSERSVSCFSWMGLLPLVSCSCRW